MHHAHIRINLSAVNSIYQDLIKISLELFVV